MDLTRIDPGKLRHFLAVLDAGSFALAAQRIGISQPAISKSIRVLEDSLGMRLFERGRAGARATPYADLLAGHARVILAEYALAEAELRSFGNATGRDLSIGASLSLAQFLLPRAIARFRQRWPEVSITIETGLSAALFDGLLGGELDLVVSGPEEGFIIDDRISRTFLFEEHDGLVVGASHPLLEPGAATLPALLDFPWIVPRHSARLDRIHAIFAANGLPPPRHMLRSESSELARGLLIAAPFVCLIGKKVLDSEIEAGRLAVLPIADFTATRPAFLSSRRGSRLSPAARNFATTLISAAKPPGAG